MKRPLIIVKLGGSVITQKDNEKGVFRKKVVDRIAREIAVAKKKKDFDLIIALGAGSFGHPLAKKYNLDQGLMGSQAIKGVALTKNSVLKLSLLVCESLMNENLNVCVAQPSAIVTTSKGEIKKFEIKFIEQSFKKRLIPVLFGDVVFDEEQGIYILSADKIVAHIAKELRADSVIFVSDVDGVFDKNPKIYSDATLIKVINRKDIEKIKTQQTNRVDVTGEMGGKLLAIKKGLEKIDVAIVNGLVKSVLEKALLGKVEGTKIV